MFWSESSWAAYAKCTSTSVVISSVSLSAWWCVGSAQMVQTPVNETLGFMQWVGLLPPGVEEERVTSPAQHHSSKSCQAGATQQGTPDLSAGM